MFSNLLLDNENNKNLSLKPEHPEHYHPKEGGVATALNKQIASCARNLKARRLAGWLLAGRLLGGRLLAGCLAIKFVPQNTNN